MKYIIRKDLKLDLGFVVLYRIERCSDKTLGGYIENESNLSQNRSAQVYGNAWVSGDARIENSRCLFNAAVAFQYPITITPQNIVIGCQLKTRKEWLKVTAAQAEKMGLPKEMYPHYRAIVRAGMKLVPEAKKKTEKGTL